MNRTTLKMKVVIQGTVLILLLYSCSATQHVRKNAKLSLQAGVNSGGIVENTDLSVVPNAQPTPESTVDAYSGATRMGGNVGVRVNIPVKSNEIETGLDYMLNSQEFTYADQGNHFIGVRNLSVSQLMIPVTYNITLFRRAMPSAELQLRLGYVAQFNSVKSKGTGLLPDYQVIPFSQGATLGVSAYLISFPNGNKLGIFADAYRGSQIYKDHYNQPQFEMPGSSFARFGLRYRWR